MTRRDARKKIFSKLAFYALRNPTCGRTPPPPGRKYPCDRFCIPTRFEEPAYASSHDLIVFFIERKNNKVNDLIVLERLQPFVPIDGKIVLYPLEVMTKVN